MLSLKISEIEAVGGGCHGGNHGPLFYLLSAQDQADICGEYGRLPDGSPQGTASVGGVTGNNANWSGGATRIVR